METIENEFISVSKKNVFFFVATQNARIYYELIEIWFIYGSICTINVYIIELEEKKPYRNLRGKILSNLRLNQIAYYNIHVYYLVPVSPIKNMNFETAKKIQRRSSGV